MDFDADGEWARTLDRCKQIPHPPPKWLRSVWEDGVLTGEMHKQKKQAKLRAVAEAAKPIVQVFLVTGQTWPGHLQTEMMDLVAAVKALEGGDDGEDQG